LAKESMKYRLCENGHWGTHDQLWQIK